MFWGVDFPKFFEVLEVRSRILKGEPLPTKVRELVLWNHGFLWFSNDFFPRKFPYIWYMVKYPIFIICGYIPKFYDFPIILGIHILGIINMTNINIKHPKYPTDWYFSILWLSYHIGNIIIPTDELHHFSEGLKQPPTRYFWCQEAFCYDFETGWWSVIRIWDSDVSHVRKFRSICLKFACLGRLSLHLWAIRWNI